MLKLNLSKGVNEEQQQIIKKNVNQSQNYNYSQTQDQKYQSSTPTLNRKVVHQFNKTDDNTINDFFAKLVEFQEQSHHLIGAQNLREFITWFDKLYHIDRRSTFMFLTKWKNYINVDYISYAETKFKRRIG